MSSLVYHPMTDPYGSIIRILQIVSAIDRPMFKDEIRIFEFLLLFPEFIDKFRLTPSLRSRFKKLQYKRKFQYEDRPSEQRLFREMEPTFVAALQTLISKGIVTIVDREGEYLITNLDRVPLKVLTIVSSKNKADINLIEFLVNLASEFQFFGINGLKDRSKLLEYRYDIV